MLKIPISFDSRIIHFILILSRLLFQRNAKPLAQPTLLVQEGEKATVRSGVDYRCEKLRGGKWINVVSVIRVKTAGLTVDLEVEKIDDNGFVTMKLDPTIAVLNFSKVQELGVFNFPISTSVS